MFWVKIEDFEAICYTLAQELLTFDQPFPPFETRFSNVLESSLLTPLQQTVSGDVYPTFEDKLTILFYLMIRNHPFLNGNKRMAVITLLIILYGNNKWINASTQELYSLAVDVSNSKPSEKDEIIKMINRFIRYHLL